MIPTPANPRVLEAMSQLFVSFPHCATLGFEYVGTDGRKPTLKLQWREDLVGNPATGIIHGGVITSLVDTCSAIAVTAHLPSIETIATLDLRIDYLKSATPGKAIHCTAECYRLASQIAFTRAVCYHDNPADPIAHGVATFMRESSRTPMLQEAQP
ncbi:PaaI family thioesterase [Chromobacterium amazonense]|uniref:Thioesterase n=1 Tax=Chromobacterium amazonense TaxID=1382803 RepID=A0A1S1XC68_9NEIS|nr:PaaI family thioesterase [Chromobacterium amazonense]KIA79189.1 thioesterase [Chromobacterium piscinae]MBM2883855.1 PaaI family thioesterase [Chromobacterium amazonense]MDE1711980.1 PaaI family thioesterase [Chromobacterium amazonense]MDQ4539862.1 PaaI family thioesterase [Chromobacterium amazonense]OHX17557.1 thioesterase [Chromobacterium amazonense]